MFLGEIFCHFPLASFCKSCSCILHHILHHLQNGLPCLWWHTPGWEVPFILSALFCKAILAAIICPHMTSPINFNGLHNQVLTLFYPSLHFTFLLILIQAPGERHTMLCLGTLRTVLHLSMFILCPKQRPHTSGIALRIITDFRVHILIFRHCQHQFNNNNNKKIVTSRRYVLWAPSIGK